MAIQDLIDIDERVQLVTSNLDKVEFNIEEYEEKNRVMASIGGIKIPVRSPKNLEKFSNTFGVPYKFAENVSQELLQSIFRELGQKEADGSFNFLIDPTNSALVSFGSSKKPYVPFSPVIGILEDHGLDVDGSLSRSGIGDIKGTHENDNSIEPRVGDVTKSGVKLHFSPTMDTPPMVLPFSERLICTNGMVREDTRERINVVGHDIDDILEQIDFQVARQFEFAGQMNQNFANLTNHQVNPIEFMQNIINSYNVPQRQRELLLTMAAGLNPDEHTAYDVINVFTQFARDLFDSGTRLSFQSMAGDMVNAGHLNCKTCGSELE